MENYAQELFLLTTTISQMNNSEGVIRLFVESMNSIFHPSVFQWASESSSPGDMEVCTRKRCYGYLSCEANRQSDPVAEHLIHNAIQILAIFLEKIEQENNLQQLVDRRTAELSNANVELAAINRNLQSQILANKQTLHILKVSEEKYKSLIDKVQTAIVLHDGEGRIIETNPLAEKLLDSTNQNLKGVSLNEGSSVVLREDGSRMPASELPVSLVLESGQSVRNYVIGIRHKENSEILWVLVNAEPEFDESGNIIQVIVSFIDITQRKKTDELLRQSQKMDAIGQLAGGVAHDFNNMLGGIVASAQLLQNPARNLDERGRMFVNLILDASSQASELTGKLLTFGRKSEISSRPVSVHSVIGDVIALLNRTIDRRIKISVIEHAEQSTVLGNSTELQNSLLNLGINASQAMPDGGELQITTRNVYLNEAYCQSIPFPLTPGDFIEIEVRDSGIGISHENLDKIFEPFFTTKEQGKGTGLGLATVYATVQNHHGAINIYSEPGTGTVFHIYLPCTGDDPSQSAGDEVKYSGKGKILLVDDEKLIRISGSETLKEMGFSVLLAENGSEAVRVFREKHNEIDLVIMDMLMPEMNGSDAFFKMKEIDEHCRVIISSGFTKDENLREMKQAGLAGFIQKPFRNNELSRLLRGVLKEE